MTLRIIGGHLKRRKLETLAGIDTRPTTDRLRESIFNIMAPFVRDANVLDLYAGSGAMGIEALSRGANYCTFIEKSKRAIKIIKKNIETCGLKNLTKVVVWDISKNLNCMEPIQQKFNLVFMDPPYNQGLICPALFHLEQSHKLESHTSIVIEHSSSEKIPDDISGFKIIDQRNYGKTVVSILHSTSLHSE